MNEYLPLAGVRVCDFSAVWAGQSATMYLADMGAEVIKVENPYVWNPMTRAASPRLSSVTANLIPPWMGGHPDGEPGPRPWNNSPAFIHVLRNKKSFTVDSRRSEGLALVKALIRVSDVLPENLAQGTLEKLGLDDDAVRAERPDIIILHLPAFGRTGRYANGRGYGAHIDSVAGSSILRGYADLGPESNTQIFTGDYWIGIHGAFAVMAALRHRRLTGEGQTIELSQVECSAQMFPQAALDAAWNGREQHSIGNRSVEGYVPNGVFPTRGDDQWIALSCRSDEEWHTLAEFIGRPGWATDEVLSTVAGRRANETMIEERLAAWCSAQDREELFHALQAAGVTAGPVLNSKEAAEDPQLAASGAWTHLPATEDYPETDWGSPAYRFSKSDVRIRTAPALFGEHNDYVYREVLGCSDEEIARLTASGHIRMTYDDSVINGA